METVLMLRRQVKRDAKRIERFKRDKKGKFTTKDTSVSIFGRTGTFILGCIVLVGMTSIAIDPSIVKKVVNHIQEQRRADAATSAPRQDGELLNPFVSVSSIKSVVNNSNSIQAEVEGDRVQDCWNKGWQPGVLDTGFVCAQPAETK